MLKPQQRISPPRNFAELYRLPAPEDYSKNYRRLTAVIILTSLFIALQIIGGILSGSIAIISDAFHLVTDLLGFIISFVFIHLARKGMDARVTFGYHRMEVIGAVLNVFIVWTMVLFIIYEATLRIVDKQFVKEPLVMLITAGGGLLVNILLYKILHNHHSHQNGHTHEEQHSHLACNHHHQNQQSRKQPQQALPPNQYHKIHPEKDEISANFIKGQNSCEKDHQHALLKKCDQQYSGQHSQKVNAESNRKQKQNRGNESIGMKSAIVHALSDLVQSIGILIAAIIIFFLGSNQGQSVTEWNAYHLFDPISTYLFSVLSLLATIPLIRSCYLLILQSSPFDIQGLRQQCKGVEGVVDLHDIHVWELKPGKKLVIAHAVCHYGREKDVLKDLTDLCRRRMIFHTTFQIQPQINQLNYISCRNDIHE